MRMQTRGRFSSETREHWQLDWKKSEGEKSYAIHIKSELEIDKEVDIWVLLSITPTISN
jgi:hypothetical protein